MDLKSGYPYWAIKNGLMHPFPALEGDLQCEIAVIGGGITGALIADHLQAAGHDVAVLEQRDIGWGSTAASTALLQYEIDTHLLDLARRLGERNAALAYRACAQALGRLHELAPEIRDVGFSRTDSLYLATRWRERAGLAEEAAARRRLGLEVEYLEAGELAERFGLTRPAALLSRQAAWVDPYRMTHRLLHRVARRGARVHDRTCIVEIIPRARSVLLRTADGVRVHARHVILATGYAAQQWLHRRVARNHSSYAFVSDPVAPESLGFLRRTMLWETARPYLYLRTTSDHRIIAGGEDDRVDIPVRRDARVMKKARALSRKLGELLPHVHCAPAFAWAGTFAETEDGLPFFGPHPQHGKRVHFAMAYGGNGITYSRIGAELLLARIERRRHPLAALFSFERLAHQ
ncbi:NAD(P)/FAD-dependent oxidoreductase [Pseudoxanthomonas beigongshangi]